MTQQEISQYNRRIVLQYMETKGHDRLKRQELFTEDGCGGLWTTDTGEPIVIHGKPRLAEHAVWSLKCFPDWEWYNVVIFNTQDPNIFWVECDGKGEEGKFYVWDFGEITAAIPNPADRQLAGDYWDFSPEGNWEGRNIARVKSDITQLAMRLGQPLDVVQARLHKIKLHLREIRSKRIAPHCDDKILADWNGLMIQALARVAMLINDPRYYQGGGAGGIGPIGGA